MYVVHHEHQFRTFAPEMESLYELQVTKKKIVLLILAFDAFITILFDKTTVHNCTHGRVHHCMSQSDISLVHHLPWLEC